ncbi:unnamed protein product [Mytilus coruscus]|uniref:Integrase zinc-binding domain-containing protein n=1 Tax=Mytilus coruscus TaxID=42192 RepID=A0A6J8D4S3_MYTCO|nr:unnamed protein product [Mytilus coruscus]
MSNIDDQIAEISRQIQSLSESTIQHGQGLISSTPKDQGVRPKVVENKDRYFHHKQELTKNQSTAHTVCSGSNDVKIKPSKYDGSTYWMDYLAHFEMCTLVNMWSEHQKDLVNALEERFAPSSQTELYRVQFKERRHKASETLPELGQSVRRLSNLAYPTAPLELRDTLAKEQFIDALVDSEMRLRIKQSRPKVLNDAIRLAVELEAYNTAESKTLKSMGHLRQTTSDERTDAPNSLDTAVSMEQMTTWMQTIENILQSLTKELRNLKIKIQSTEGTHKNDFDTDGTVNILKSEVKSTINDNDAVVVSASEDAVMFVELSIQDVPVKFVVDTGATLTVVSSRVYDLIPDLCRPHLSETRSQIKSVCDKYLSLRGTGSFTLDFGKGKFTSEAVVTDLQVDGILGLDFMKKNKCLIDVSTKLLHFDNFKVPLVFQGTQNRNVHRKPCRLTSDRQSKTDRDCSKIEQSQVNIVTSKMPDKGKDLTLNELQSNDSDLKRVKRWLTEGQRPQYNEVSSKGYFLRSLWSQFDSLELQEDIVVRRFNDLELNVAKLQAVIPMSERKQVLEYCHKKKYAGHLGTHKTLKKIHQSYYWPGLQSDVRAYVTSCTKCNRKKRPMKRKRASIRLEEDNVRHESKRPAWMADYVNK